MKEKNPLLSQHESGGGIGPIIGALIIVVMLAIGAVYYWAQHLNLLQQEQELRAAQQAAFQASENGPGRTTASTTLGTSTKISDIEKDLNNSK